MNGVPIEDLILTVAGVLFLAWAVYVSIRLAPRLVRLAEREEGWPAPAKEGVTGDVRGQARTRVEVELLEIRAATSRERPYVSLRVGAEGPVYLFVGDKVNVDAELPFAVETRVAPRPVPTSGRRA